jgi:hypothetical protein
VKRTTILSGVEQARFKLGFLYIRKYLFLNEGKELDLKAFAVKKVNLISKQFDENPE